MIHISLGRRAKDSADTSFYHKLRFDILYEKAHLSLLTTGFKESFREAQKALEKWESFEREPCHDEKVNMFALNLEFCEQEKDYSKCINVRNS